MFIAAGDIGYCCSNWVLQHTRATLEYQRVFGRSLRMRMLSKKNPMVVSTGT